jgi:hypothetical protein
MKECDKSKIYISSNFVFIYLIIMFDTLLLRPSLHCSTSLHFTTLHPTTLHYTYRHFTYSHIHFSSLSFGLSHSHFLSFYFTSHHKTRHSTVVISKLISKIMNPFAALKNLSPFHFTSLPFSFFILFYFIFTFYTGCPRRNVPDFGRMFLMLKYTDIPKTPNPKLNGYGDNGQRKVWSFCGSTYCTCSADAVPIHCACP